MATKRTKADQAQRQADQLEKKSERSGGRVEREPAPTTMRATIAREGKEICREEKPGSIVLDKIQRRECYS